jgi:hypothetical protein
MSVTEARETRSRGRQAAKAAALAFVLVCNAALFAPVEIFRGNAVEFSVPLAPILLVYLLPALVVVLLAASIGALISPGPFRRYLVLLAALAVLTWAQGTFLVWDYGVLDGSPIHWLEGWWRGAIDTSLWLLVLLGTYLGYRRFERPVILAAAASFLIQLVALLPALFSSEAVAANGEARVLDRGAYAAMSQFSSNGNVLHIVMDGFQSDIFSEIVADPEYDWIADTLTGFTFFDQHTGTFPYTQMTIPLIVSGKTYRNEVPIDDFTAAASSPIATISPRIATPRGDTSSLPMRSAWQICRCSGSRHISSRLTFIRTISGSCSHCSGMRPICRCGISRNSIFSVTWQRISRSFVRCLSTNSST